jgi:hypothetical protein
MNKKKKSKISSLHMLGNRKRNASAKSTRKALNSRAQMKIQQMMFMLLAITIFFVLVGLIVLSVSLSGIKTEATELEKEEALSLVSKLANSPEFACENSFDNVYGMCVDSDKIMALKENIDSYSDFWGIAGIEIQKVFPKNTNECNSGNYPNCGRIKVYSKDVNTGGGYSIYVPLCRKESYEGETYSKCEIALLSVYPEDKTTQ